MLVNANFQSLIANTFYDKEISIIGYTDTTDVEGDFVKSSSSVVLGTFKGNVQYKNFKEVQNDYGIDKQIDVYITTGTDTTINIDDFIQYNNVTYKVTDVLTYDTHKVVMGSIWE